MSEGYIALHRKLKRWEWYKDANTFRLFIHCLIEANFKDKRWQGIEVKRTTFITSLNSLAEDLNLSIKQIRTSLNKLKKTGELAHERTNRYSVITVINYDLYQIKDDKGASKEADNKADKGQSEGKQRAHTNNVNNEDNDNKKDIADAFLIFYNSGIRKCDKQDSRKTFEKLCKGKIEQQNGEKILMTPMEFALMLKADVMKRLNLGQLGFDALSPKRYLKHMRWTDEYKPGQRFKDQGNNFSSVQDELREKIERHRSSCEPNVAQVG